MSPRAPSLQQRVAERPVPVALASITVLAVLVRLYRLGSRVFYYDEVWFGYWILRFLEHGAWEYRPILHGPFFVRVNPVVFSALGVSDFSARLVVALLGGLLPLAAWLFRDHLSSGEVVALGVALAFNPVLLYYSRFMRKDLPLAAFMLVTLGLLVRVHATGRRRYLYAAGVTLGLAFTTKESVLLWVLTWLGAAALCLDHRLVRTRARNGDVVARLRTDVDRAVAGFRRWVGPGLRAVLLCLTVVVYFYAPRAGPGQEIGLWRALGGEFGTIPAVLDAATAGALEKAIQYWVAGSIQQHPYLPYLTDTLLTLRGGALGVSLLAVLGFLWDRYAGGTSRSLVAFNFYCGVAAVLGYPLANNVPVPWSTVHAIVPLTVPAAVGAVVVYRWGRSRLPAREPAPLSRLPVSLAAVRAGLAAGLLAYLVVTAGATAVETSYHQPHESPRGEDSGHQIVYYAQAPGDIGAVVDAIETAASDGSDPDVLYVGSRLAMNESAVEQPPATGAWHARNPLPWYTEAHDATVESVVNDSAMSDEPPPVVITTDAEREAVDETLGSAYRSQRYQLDDVGDRSVVVFVRNESGG